MQNWQPFPFDPRSIDAVALTHAHIDHSGALPLLVKRGFKGPIYCTTATKELARILLADAARLQEEDAEYANRKGFSKHHPALPLYTEEEAARALESMRSLPEGHSLAIGNLQLALHNAGHILGSAFVSLRRRTATAPELVFSGDVGPYDAPLHPDPRPRPACDTLVMEATYGHRKLEAIPLEDQLKVPFERTIARKGTILIPAFAVARAQLVLFLLKRLMDSGRLPALPIYVDSPMATAVSHVYAQHVGTGELEVQRNDLLPPGVHFCNSAAESKALNDKPGPRIIIASSGMMTGGRVVHHLEHLLPDSRNLIVLVGYQAAGTRGRALLDGAKTLRMHGRDVPVKAEFMLAAGLSAHADQDDLIRWLHSNPTRPRTTFLVHGESEGLDGLATRLRAEGLDTVIPQLDDRFRLEESGHWRRLSFMERVTSDEQQHPRG